MKKFLIGAVTALTIKWAWDHYDMSSKVSPYVEGVKSKIKARLSSLKCKENDN